jgi:FixJ family two-component response regulator
MGEIFIVDDDSSVRAALSIVLSAEGFATTGFADGESFLAAAPGRAPGCVLIDVHLPGCSGLDLLKKLDAQSYPAPILVISGVGQIPTVVEAIRHGAQDYIEKPFDPAMVVARVREAMEAWRHGAHDAAQGETLPPDFPGHERLTAREREVLGRIAQGASNKEAGRELGISPRTIEVHRARIMEKLGAKNAADLMRIVIGKARGRRTSATLARQQSHA